MDRTIVYVSQQPSSKLWLTHERNMMVALSMLSQGVLGTTTVADGLAATPTIPASLAVNFGPGSIYQQEPLDSTPYGVLPVDMTHVIVKQGIGLDTVSLTLTPPPTAGQAVNYLIQAQLSEIDGDNTVLPYFNSSNPQQPYTGPAGSGDAQPTTRKCQIALQAKSGTAATAGTQVTPSPDPGWIGLYSITVANGDTAITSGKIATLANAPLINIKLPDLPRWVQQGAWLFGSDTGTANAINVTLNPQPVVPPTTLMIRKAAVANTGAMTVTISGVGTYPLLNADGSAMVAAEMSSNYLAVLGFDGTAYRFINTTTSTSVGSFTGTSGEGINVSGSNVVSLNYPSLTDKPTIQGVDLMSYFSIGDNHHRVLTYSEFLASFIGLLPGSLLRITPITTSQTWNRGLNTKRVLVFCTGAGGGGGGDPYAVNGYAGCGGAGGGTSISFVDVSAVPTVACVIGTPGLGVVGGDGTNGTASSFGSYAAADGGQGGLNSQKLTTAINNPASIPGSGTVGNVLLTGEPGGIPMINKTAGLDGNWGGNGGASFWGGGGVGYRNQGSGVGTPAGNGTNGSGGAGGDHGTTSVKGGDGGPGFILIFEFS